MPSRNTRPRGALTLRVLAALLGYPDASLRELLPELRRLLRHDQALTASRLGEIEALIDGLARMAPLQAEQAYVELFDHGRATSLHLFEHVHGDSRDRGPAMIDLAETYQSAGLALREGELPDYLPAVLEFASTQPAREAKALLGEIAHLVNAILSALVQRHSPYASVLAALLDLAGQPARPVALAPEAPLDESWAEPPAFDGCSVRGQARPGEPQPVHLIRPQRDASRGATP